MMEKRGIVFKTLLFLAAMAGTAANGAPQVVITTSFSTASADLAKTCPHVPDGTFVADVSDAPVASEETVIDDPVYIWTITPDDDLTFTPNGHVAALSLGENAFGKSYTIKVEVTWTERDSKTGAVIGEVEASDTISLDAIQERLSITHSNLYCWDGGEITFTATYADSGYTCTHPPTWSASVGDFPGGSTGFSVVWRSPSGSGGVAPISATAGGTGTGAALSGMGMMAAAATASGGGGVDAQDSVTYVHVEMPSGKEDLLREETDTLSATVTPADAPVVFSQGACSPMLDVSCESSNVTVRNKIQRSDIQAHEDSATAKIHADLAGCSEKWFEYVYDMKKWLADWEENVMKPVGEFAYETLGDAAVTELKSRLKNTASGLGINALRSDVFVTEAGKKFNGWASKNNPFPGKVTNSKIKESATFSWSTSWTALLGAGNITIKKSEYPGYPDITAPTPAQWITGINEYGFSEQLFVLSGVSSDLGIKAEGANWSAKAGVLFKCSDSFGNVQFMPTITIKMQW
jgi:hypothetical protein